MSTFVPAKFFGRGANTPIYIVFRGGLSERTPRGGGTAHRIAGSLAPRRAAPAQPPGQAVTLWRAVAQAGWYQQPLSREEETNSFSPSSSGSVKVIALGGEGEEESDYEGEVLTEAARWYAYFENDDDDETILNVENDDDETILNKARSYFNITFFPTWEDVNKIVENIPSECTSLFSVCCGEGLMEWGILQKHRLRFPHGCVAVDVRIPRFLQKRYSDHVYMVIHTDKRHPLRVHPSKSDVLMFCWGLADNWADYLRT